MPRWISNQKSARLYISALSGIDLELGVLRIARGDPGQGGQLRTWLERQVLPELAERILVVDGTAALHVPDPRAERDALVAATALVHGMSVATRNARNFETAGVAIDDPREEKA